LPHPAAIGEGDRQKKGTDPGAGIRRLIHGWLSLVRTVPPFTWPDVSPIASRKERASEWAAELLPVLYRQVRALAGPRPDLDDLVQAAAERALKTLGRFEGRAQLSTWTYAIAYRTVLDHDRWRFRWARRFQLAGDDERPESAADVDVEGAALEATRAASLHRALARIVPSKRAVVVLHDLEGLELKEVAAIVGVNERTVRSRLHDARKKLLGILAADPAFDREGRR
jgi:RNA polymerase sigma-70 factor (ECF subfamily)